MDNPSELREHYGRLSDEDLKSIAAIDSDSLTPEARQALANELARRPLRAAGTLPNAVSEPVQRSSSTGEWQYPKARLGARFLAYIIDGVVMVVPPIVLGAILFILSRRSGLDPIAGVGLLLCVAWALYYSFAKDGWNRGQSIGKKAMDLMVVNVKTNVPCTVGESALRGAHSPLAQPHPRTRMAHRADRRARLRERPPAWRPRRGDSGHRYQRVHRGAISCAHARRAARALRPAA